MERWHAGPGDRSRGAWGGGGTISAQEALNCGDCWLGTRGAHVENDPHACDSGRVPAQRLVERHRALPSRTGSMGRGAAEQGSREVGAGRGAVAAQVVRREDCGMARAKHTKNIASMVVTLLVSQLSGWLNTDAHCRGEREASEEE